LSREVLGGRKGPGPELENWIYIGPVWQRVVTLLQITNCYRGKRKRVTLIPVPYSWGSGKMIRQTNTKKKKENKDG